MIPQDLAPAILEGDVIDLLRSLPGDSIHCVVTSPPYWGLRDYGLRPVRWGGKARCEHEWEPTRPPRHRGAHGVTGEVSRGNAAVAYDASGGGSTCRRCGGWLGQLGLEPTPERFVEHLAEVFDEVRRVLRPDGTLWLNLGDTYATHPSGLTGEKRWKASTLAGRDRTGAEQAGRMDKRAPGLKPKDLVGIPWRVAFELQRRGWWLRSDCVWAKPNPMPEAVRDRPTRAHDSVFLLTKSRRYFYDAYAVREPLQESTLRRLRHHLPNPADNRTSRSKHPEGDFRRFPMLRNTSPLGSESPDSLVDPDPALPRGPFRDVPGETPGALHPGGILGAGGVRGVRKPLDERGPCNRRSYRPRTTDRSTARVGTRPRRRRARVA